MLRAPHIHFDVLGKSNRLVTQMYFAGEPLNETDRFLAVAGGNKERLIAAASGPSPQAEGQPMTATWDIVVEEA